MTPTKLPPDPDSTPLGLIRLSAAARLAGITPELLETGAANGEIPVEIIQPGKRIKYVRAAELGNWLRGRQPS